MDARRVLICIPVQWLMHSHGRYIEFYSGISRDGRHYLGIVCCKAGRIAYLPGITLSASSRPTYLGSPTERQPYIVHIIYLLLYQALTRFWPIYVVSDNIHQINISLGAPSRSLCAIGILQEETMALLDQRRSHFPEVLKNIQLELMKEPHLKLTHVVKYALWASWHRSTAMFHPSPPVSQR